MANTYLTKNEEKSLVRLAFNPFLQGINTETWVLGTPISLTFGISRSIQLGIFF